MKPKKRLPSLSEEGKLLQKPETDPQGSWTGVPAEPEEQPVQDVDDL